VANVADQADVALRLIVLLDPDDSRCAHAAADEVRVGRQPNDLRRRPGLPFRTSCSPFADEVIEQRFFAGMHESGDGPSRHFVAAQQLGRFRR
jgi:hypothetical protein